MTVGQRSPGVERTGWRRFVVSVGYLGFVPGMPGTAASVAALLAGLAVEQWLPHGTIVLAGLIVVASIVGLALSPWAELGNNGRDPRWFVLDEVAGMWVAMWRAPGGWLGVAVAFLLFRALDIAKPPPVRQAERLLGAGGIMFDDLAAGVLANLLLQAGWMMFG